MTYGEKKKIVLFYIKRNLDYVHHIFDIDKYFEITEDLITQDLNNLDFDLVLDYNTLSSTRILMNNYYGNFDLKFLDIFKEKLNLVLYARFLLKIHKEIIDKNIRSFELIRKMHIVQYLRYKSYKKNLQDLDSSDELRWFFSDLKYNNL